LRPIPISLPDQLALGLRRVCRQMAEPRGCGRVIPVEPFFRPGCPPEPQVLRHGVLQRQRRIHERRVFSR